MSFKCTFGLHSWDGCKCSDCGMIKDENHLWDRCRCIKCGYSRDENHVYNDCLCEKCGKIRNENHTWEGCICKKCNQKRDEQHTWKSDDCSTCEKCGKVAKLNHTWSGCKCRICSKTRDEFHQWVGLKCSKCGIVNTISQKQLNDKLLSAIKKKDFPVEEIKNLILDDADIEISDNSMWTPLHYAVFYNSKELVLFLINSGCKIDARDCIGMTPLYRAWHTGFKELFKILLANGADINVKTLNGMSMIIEAVSLFNDKNKVEELIEAGVNINTLEAAKLTPLLIAIRNYRIDIAELLIKNGAIVNNNWYQINSFISPLQLAKIEDKKRKNNEFEKLLVRHGATE